MVICASFYLEFRLFKVRSLRSRGGEIPEFASRDLACFDYQNNSQHIHTAPCGATSAFADALGVKYTPGFIAPVMGDTYLKQHDAPEDIEYYLCGPPMMSKTVLDLLHSLGVEDDMIMFDNFGG